MKIYSFLLLLFVVPCHCMEAPPVQGLVKPSRPVTVNIESFKDERACDRLYEKMRKQALAVEPFPFEIEGQNQYQKILSEYKALLADIPNRDEALSDKLYEFHKRLAEKLKLAQRCSQDFFVTKEQENELKTIFDTIAAEIYTTSVFQMLHLLGKLPDTSDPQKVEKFRQETSSILAQSLIKINPQGKDKHGNTICHLLVCNNFTADAQKFLAKHKGAHAVLNNLGLSPFHILLRQNPINKTLAEWMIDTFKLVSDGSGFTPLHYAARFCPSLLQRVIDKQKIDVNTQSRDSRETPLSVAVCYFGEAVKRLLQQPTIEHSFTLPDHVGFLPLDKALMAENPTDEINTLIDRGAQMSSAGIGRLSNYIFISLKTFKPLHVILLKDVASHFALIQDHRSEQTCTPEIHSSVQRTSSHGQPAIIDPKVQGELIKLLQSKNSNPKQISKFLSQHQGKYSLQTPIKKFPTALMYAVANGKTALVQQLLANGADCAYADNQDKSALTYAARLGRVELIDLLCKHGADPNQILGVEMEGKEKTARVPIIYFSVLFCSEEVTKKLVQNGAKMNVLNEGFSPIHIGIKYGKTLNVIALLEAGADPHIRTDLGNTPLHCAACYGKDEQDCVSTLILLNKGAIADLFVPNKEGKTPIDFAQITNNPKFITQSLNYGLLNGFLRFNDQSAPIKHDELVQGLTATTTRLFATPNGLLTIGVTTGSS